MSKRQNTKTSKRKRKKQKATNEDINGGTNHFLSLNLSKILTSISWAKRKAVPDAIAILIEIKSEKFVEKKKCKKNT